VAQLLLKERDNHVISGQNDVADFVFVDDLSEAFDHFFGMLVVRIARPARVASLGPPTHLYAMNLLPVEVFRDNHQSWSHHEDTRRIRVRKHGGIARIQLIELGKQIQMRLVIGEDVVVSEGSC